MKSLFVRAKNAITKSVTATKHCIGYATTEKGLEEIKQITEISIKMHKESAEKTAKLLSAGASEFDVTTITIKNMCAESYELFYAKDVNDAVSTDIKVYLQQMLVHITDAGYDVEGDDYDKEKSICWNYFNLVGQAKDDSTGIVAFKNLVCNVVPEVGKALLNVAQKHYPKHIEHFKDVYNDVVKPDTVSEEVAEQVLEEIFTTNK